MPNKTVLGQQGFVRLSTILKLIPVGKSTWWAGVRSGRFPQGVKLGRNTTAWRVEDIRALMESFNASPANASPRVASQRVQLFSGVLIERFPRH